MRGVVKMEGGEGGKPSGVQKEGGGGRMVKLPAARDNLCKQKRGRMKRISKCKTPRRDLSFLCPEFLSLNFPKMWENIFWPSSLSFFRFRVSLSLSFLSSGGQMDMIIKETMSGQGEKCWAGGKRKKKKSSYFPKKKLKRSFSILSLFPPKRSQASNCFFILPPPLQRLIPDNPIKLWHLEAGLALSLVREGWEGKKPSLTTHILGGCFLGCSWHRPGEKKG